ncbi:replication-relaxation family protein [Thermicanus aegyptius]|uniref:replication-relaxation family protein n=1 Tax=Thermicanus aegyptius TaxID=94009 RepID=UPI00040854B7|nr:replication-relaxation family protein [Thermicanus aegyptius]
MPDTIKRINERDLEILSAIYKHRVLTTEQIAEMFFDGKKNYCYRKLYLMKNTGLIESYSRIKKEGRATTGGYYITDKGITLLHKNGKIESKVPAANNRVNQKQIGYLAKVNQIFLELAKSGWQYKDSREVKREENRNRGDLVQGKLISPAGVEYEIYYLEDKAKEVAIVKVIKEITFIAKTTNIAVFFGGETSFRNFIEKSNQLRLVMGGEILLLPYNFGIRYLKHYASDEELFQALGKEVIKSDHPWLKWISKEGGEYLVNLLTNDYMMIFNLTRMTEEQKQKYGREIKVLVANRMVSEYQKYFRDQHFITFESIDIKDLFNERGKKDGTYSDQSA